MSLMLDKTEEPESRRGGGRRFRILSMIRMAGDADKEEGRSPVDDLLRDDLDSGLECSPCCSGCPSVLGGVLMLSWLLAGNGRSGHMKRIL